MEASKPVLFVDDDPTTRKIHETKARAEGITPLLAANPTEAVSLLRAHEVALIVTDINMPEYDGVDLIRAVREYPKTKAVPIIVLTYGGNLEKIQTADAMGANEIYDKGACSLEQLFGRIKALLH